MSEEKPALLKEDIAAIAYAVEARIVDQLKRRMAWESKKVFSQLKGLAFALEKAIRDIEQSVDILAREFARQREDTDGLQSKH